MRGLCFAAGDGRRATTLEHTNIGVSGAILGITSAGPLSFGWRGGRRL